MLGKKGFILIVTYLIIVILVIIFGATLIARTIGENAAAKRIKQLTQAFELAEAGIDRALRALKLDFDSPKESGVSITMGVLSSAFDLPSLVSASQIVGQYKYRIDTTTSSDIRRIRAMGYVPNADNPAVTRWVEAYVERVSPPTGYFDNAIWTTGDVTINGDAYSVKGEDYTSSIDEIDNDSDLSIDEAGERDGVDNDNDLVIDEAGEGGNINYGGQIIGDVSNVAGDETKLSSDIKFYYLNFDAFRNMAIEQNNLYTATNLADKTYMKNYPFPTSYWRDAAKTEANVIYLEGDLDVSGNIQLGGIFIVAKDVIASAGSADIGGTIDFNGIIYTLGDIKIHGTVDLLGSVWSGAGGAELDGNVTLGLNYTYVSTFKKYITDNPSINLKSWHEPKLPIAKDTLL